MFLYFALTLLAINFYTLIEFFRKLLKITFPSPPGVLGLIVDT
jgi:hypothetical protein